MLFKRILCLIIVLFCEGIYSQCLQNITVLDDNGILISNYEVLSKDRSYKCFSDGLSFPLKKGEEVTIKKEGFLPYKIVLTDRKQKISLQRDESFWELNPMVVTGKNRMKPLSESAVYTRVISNKDIISGGGNNLKDVLEREIPSISFTNHAGVPNIRMHGLGDNRILILLNGERIAGETHNNIDYSQIDVNDIDRIEIVQGASFTLYGSGAIGGVINIITKKNKRNNLSVLTRYNSNEAFKSSIIGGVSIGKLSLKTGLRFDTNKEVAFKDKKPLKYIYDNGNVKIDSTLSSTHLRAQDLWSVKQEINYKLLPNLNFGVGVTHYEKYQKRADARKKIIQDNYYSTRVVFNADWKRKKWEHQMLASYNHYIKKDYFLRIKEYEEKYRNNINYLRYLLNYKTENLGWLNGVELTKSDLKTYMFVSNEVKSDYTLSALSELDWQFVKDFYFLGGVRIDRYQHFGSAITPKIAFKHKLLKNINVRWNFSTGFRAPTLKELYTDWDHLGMFRIIGNKNLKPEKSISYMTTVEKEGKRVYASLSFFKTDIKQKIQLYWNNSRQDTLVYRNYDNQKLWGVDFISKIRLLRNVKLNLGYSYTYDKIWENGHNISSTRPHSFNFNLNYDIHLKRLWNASLSCNGNYYSGVNLYFVDDDKNYYRTEYPEYFLLNINTIFRYKRYISVNLGTENILNYSPERYNFYTPMVNGTLYKVGLNINLN